MTKPVRVAVFDLDGTLTRSDTYLWFLIGALVRSPSRWIAAPALAWAVGMFAARRRDNAWLKAFFLRRIVGGQPALKVQAWAQAHIERVLRADLMPGAQAEIARLRAAGVRLVLASASPDVYVTALAERLGFDDIICTRAVRGANGAWTGELDGGNCRGDEKRRRVDAHLAALGSGWNEAAFYSDHHSDWPLLEAAAQAYAVNPTRRLVGRARQAGIPVLDWRS